MAITCKEIAEKALIIQEELMGHLWGEDLLPVNEGGYVPSDFYEMAEELTLLSGEMHRAANRLASYIAVCNRRHKEQVNK